ncbi:MAG: tol-pal system-associated acyl-CoA thioesterase [Ahniella sp.]|nr:tol-pal system-associated acyl-CoA thioesterase [Ahniella sp.]
MPAEPAFSWPIRVYYEDTDAGGVVYHANYLRFFERARTEWLRAQGIAQSRFAAETGLVFVLSELSVSFRRPARLDDELSVSCTLAETRAASLRFTQQLVRSHDQELLVGLECRVALIDAGSFKPVVLPESLKEKLRTCIPN